MISLNISGFLKKGPGRLIHLVKHSIKEIKEKRGGGGGGGYSMKF